MICKTIAFGRMWRYGCDADDCEETFAVVAGDEPPEGWSVSGEICMCPTHTSMRTS